MLLRNTECHEYRAWHTVNIHQVLVLVLAFVCTMSNLSVPVLVTPGVALPFPSSKPLP